MQHSLPAAPSATQQQSASWSKAARPTPPSCCHQTSPASAATAACGAYQQQTVAISSAGCPCLAGWGGPSAAATAAGPLSQEDPSQGQGHSLAALGDRSLACPCKGGLLRARPTLGPLDGRPSPPYATAASTVRQTSLLQQWQQQHRHLTAPRRRLRQLLRLLRLGVEGVPWHQQQQRQHWRVKRRCCSSTCGHSRRLRQQWGQPPRLRRWQQQWQQWRYRKGQVLPHVRCPGVARRGTRCQTAHGPATGKAGRTGVRRAALFTARALRVLA